MTIEDRKVVTFHYSLRNSDGVEIESSRKGDPVTYLHGYRNIVPGLEKAMAGRDIGDAFEVTVEPVEAYGERNPNNVQRIPAKHFPNARKLKAGQFVELQTKAGPIQAVIVKVGRFNVDVDANHPLAGQALTFDVEIKDLRDATQEEIDHGHVHGPGGVNH
ncbi:MAG: peptidylprolyl isomerase [Gammaproteobacteria bacterium]|nr:peptidylprolyl isomerase [Gammaproteobacteria bacterium]NNJ77819.1 peptidylprolyl isomerase [Xanthomonadales bacterium]